MMFRTLVFYLSLALTATCSEFANDYYGSERQIEEFSSSYAVVNPNYHLVKLPCNGCPNKLSGSYSTEYLVLNFSTAADAVLLNGKQIYPVTDPAPEIFVHQVSTYIDLNIFDYDYRSANRYDLPFFPLSRLGYVVNATSQAHPPGSSNSTSLTLDFRVIQVGPSFQDCLDTVALALFRPGTGPTLAVKGARFVQNNESFLPDTEDSNPRDYYTPSFVTASGARKCHPSHEDYLARRPAYQYDDYNSYYECYRRRVTPLKWFVVVLGSFLLGLFIALLGVYFRAGLHRGASRVASIVRCFSVAAWSRLRGGRSGAIRLPTSVKKDMVDSPEQE